jgi:hypothetical protein
VQILDRELRKVAGTGAVVSPEGHVATCAHVVRSAGVDPARIGGEVGVLRPEGPRQEGWTGIATLVATPLPDHGDDIVLLRLLGERTFDDRDFAHLGPGEELDEDEEFRTWGFPDLDRMSGGDLGRGLILGPVPAPSGKPWRIEPLRLSAEDAIVPGMSGSPVLARSRNHVVGFLFGRYGKADAAVPASRGWAADALELAEADFGLSLEDEPYLLPREQRVDAAEEHAATAAQGAGHQPRDPRNRPPTPCIWVGRHAVFHELTARMDDPDTRIIGVIGLGGQGKSTAVARWLEQTRVPGERVFWWTFGTGDVDRFIEEAVRFVGSDPAEVRRPLQQAHRIVAAAKATPYLFVLDGLEAAQYQAGHAYGSFSNPELAAFLDLFASERHRSFCILTSRAPVHDLLAYSSYDWIELGRLSPDDGVALLRQLGVIGAEAELRALVERADGHALTLTLLAGYLVTRFQGRIPDVDLVGRRLTSGDHAQRVAAVLREYDILLTDADRSMVQLLAAVDGPVSETLVQRLLDSAEGRAAVLDVDTASAFDAADRLSRLGILAAREHEGVHEYLLHAIVGAYYREQLSADAEQSRRMHRALARAYVADRAAPELDGVTLADLEPFMRAVTHACAAGDFDSAYHTYSTRVDQLDGERGVLAYRLGAYQADLGLVLEFFPGRDVTQAPRLTSDADNEYLLRSVGLGLMTVGRLLEAFPVCRRSRQAAATLGDALSETRALQLLAELNIHTGRLTDAADVSRRALAAAARVDDDEERLEEEACSLAYEAWTWHLRGEVDRAEALFSDAQARQEALAGEGARLDDLWGVYHAEHLRRTGRAAEAVEHLRANMSSAGTEQPEVLSECHRVLGDIALDQEGPSSVTAEAHYGEALKIARTITHRAILIEAMIGRGRLGAERGDVAAAQLDLFTVLDLSRESSYALYSADAHLYLALAYARGDDDSVARRELMRASGAAEAVDYHWGAQAAEQLRLTLDAARPADTA